MNLIEMSEAQELMSPYANLLYSLPTRAWDAYHRQTPPELLVEYTPRTRASSIHDLMVAYARKEETQKLRVFDHRRMKGVAIENRLVARLKKFDEDSVSCSQPTRQVRDFRNQRSLPGFPSTHNIEVGYVMNASQTEITEVRVAQPSGKGIAWWFAINSTGIHDGAVNIFTMPPNGPQDEGAGVIIKVKETAQGAVILPFKKGES